MLTGSHLLTLGHAPVGWEIGQAFVVAQKLADGFRHEGLMHQPGAGEGLPLLFGYLKENDNEKKAIMGLLMEEVAVCVCVAIG